MARYELSDGHWNLIKGLFPKQGRGGRWNDHRTMLNGMLWILRSGAPWRDLPERYGKWKSVYSYDHIRQFLHSCGIEPVIPRKSNQPRPAGERFDHKTYRKRSGIECAVGWLKENRRLGTRYEKLAVNFLAFAKLAFMRKYLRLLDPSDRA